MEQILNCEFSQPTTFDGTPALTKQDFWQFSKITCSTDTGPIEAGPVYELVQNKDYPTRQFFVDKSMSYGDSLIVLFLTIFLFWAIAEKIINYFWKR